MFFHNVFLDKLAELCVYLSFHLSCFLYVTLREKTCGETLIPDRNHAWEIVPLTTQSHQEIRFLEIFF
jgi:hypothetical protein